LKFLTLGAAVGAFAISLGAASAAGQSPAFTISGGTTQTLLPTGGPPPIPLGTTGYRDALLSISHAGAYKFEFLGCGTATFDNRFYLRGSNVPGKTFPRGTAIPKFFDCKTSKIGDHFIVNLTIGAVGPHSPFSFQASADTGGPSVFNGEGPLTGTYTNNLALINTSIFYAVDGSTADPGATSGDAVLLVFVDGGVPNDIGQQNMDVRISLRHHQ